MSRCRCSRTRHPCGGRDRRPGVRVVSALARFSVMTSARVRCAAMPEALTASDGKETHPFFPSSMAIFSGAELSLDQLARDTEAQRVFGKQPGFAVQTDVVAVVVGFQAGHFDGMPRRRSWRSEIRTENRCPVSRYPGVSTLAMFDAIELLPDAQQIHVFSERGCRRVGSGVHHRRSHVHPDSQRRAEAKCLKRANTSRRAAGGGAANFRACRTLGSAIGDSG